MIKYLGICHHVEKEMMLQATNHEIKSAATCDELEFRVIMGMGFSDPYNSPLGSRWL